MKIVTERHIRVKQDKKILSAIIIKMIMSIAFIILLDAWIFFSSLYVFQFWKAKSSLCKMAPFKVTFNKYIIRMLFLIHNYLLTQHLAVDMAELTTSVTTTFIYDKSCFRN